MEFAIPPYLVHILLQVTADHRGIVGAVQQQQRIVIGFKLLLPLTAVPHLPKAVFPILVTLGDVVLNVVFDWVRMRWLGVGR